MTQAVVESLRILPVGTPLLSYLSVESISAWVTGLFVIALKVVIPYFGVLLLAEIGLGFMARMVPQMNIFMLGFPIKILLALFLLTFLAVPMIKHILPYSIEKFLEMVPLFIGR
jgi:flagellar biosynthetic protein FliR